MNQEQLDDLFSSSTPGATPEGVAKGTVIAAAGTPAAPALASLLGLAWQGKVFYESDHDLLNRILPIGLRAVRAAVYTDTSWFDGKGSDHPGLLEELAARALDPGRDPGGRPGPLSRNRLHPQDEDDQLRTALPGMTRQMALTITQPERAAHEGATEPRA